MRFYTLVILSLIMLAGCMPSPYYQKSYTIPQNSWQSQYQPTFKIDVTDTTRLYNLFLLIRHTDAYQFSNIWLNVYTKQPGDTTFQKSRIEIPLAAPTGQWLGHGMGEIWEQRLPITYEGDRSILKKKGTYEIRFEQNMRVDPLPDVLQIGLRIEKGGERPAVKDTSAKS